MCRAAGVVAVGIRAVPGRQAARRVRLVLSSVDVPVELNRPPTQPANGGLALKDFTTTTYKAS